MFAAHFAAAFPRIFGWVSALPSRFEESQEGILVPVFPRIVRVLTHSIELLEKIHGVNNRDPPTVVIKV